MWTWNGRTEGETESTSNRNSSHGQEKVEMRTNRCHLHDETQERVKGCTDEELAAELMAHGWFLEGPHNLPPVASRVTGSRATQHHLEKGVTSESTEFWRTEAPTDSLHWGSKDSPWTSTERLQTCASKCASVCASVLHLQRIAGAQQRRDLASRTLGSGHTSPQQWAHP